MARMNWGRVARERLARERGVEQIHPSDQAVDHCSTLSTPRCGVCGRRAVLRIGKFGKFLGCSRYPVCRATCKVSPDGKPVGNWKPGLRS